MARRAAGVASGWHSRWPRPDFSVSGVGVPRSGDGGRANRASSRRFEAPTLSKMLVRWCLTVSSLSSNFFGDLLVAEAGDHGGDDLDLARGEPEARLRGRRGVAVAPQRVHEIGHGLAADPVLAGHHAADALEQQLRRTSSSAPRPPAPSCSAFTISAFSIAAVRRIVRTGAVAAARARARASIPESAGHRCRGRAGGRPAERAGQPHRVLAVARLADDHEARLRLEQAAQALAEDRVVVGDDDADGPVRVEHR